MISPSFNGSCLCRKVTYSIQGKFDIFQYCHCSRCRKFTGSAFAANIFVTPENFTWKSGAGLIGRYELETTKYFATSFCKHCGSSLPWLSQSGKMMIVPAGTLDDDPGIRPQQNIFTASCALWYVEPHTLKTFDALPPKK